MECPKCGYAMTAFDVECPRCKAMEARPGPTRPNAPPAQKPPQPTPQVYLPTPAPTPTPTPTPNALWGGVSLIGLAVGLWIVSAVMCNSGSHTPSPAETAQDEKIEAWVMAEEFVRRNLKSPDTADFGSAFKDYQDPEKCVVSTGPGSFRVTGWVDAQNSFGAKLRNRFTCSLRRSGDTWTCEDIQLSDW